MGLSLGVTTRRTLNANVLDGKQGKDGQQGARAEQPMAHQVHDRKTHCVCSLGYLQRTAVPVKKS